MGQRCIGMGKSVEGELNGLNLQLEEDDAGGMDWTARMVIRFIGRVCD